MAISQRDHKPLAALGVSTPSKRQFGTEESHGRTHSSQASPRLRDQNLGELRRVFITDYSITDYSLGLKGVLACP
jgi:hypothetical protein